jgi:hypothetical protein
VMPPNPGGLCDLLYLFSVHRMDVWWGYDLQKELPGIMLSTQQNFNCRSLHSFNLKPSGLAVRRRSVKCLPAR